MKSPLLWRSVRFCWSLKVLLEEFFLIPPVICDCRQRRQFFCWSLPSPSAGCLITSSPCGWSLVPFRWTTHLLPSVSSLTVCHTGIRASTPSSTPFSPRTSDRRVGRSSPVAFCVRRRQTRRLFVFGQRTCPVRILPPTYKEHSLSWQVTGYHTRTFVWSLYSCHRVRVGKETTICSTLVCTGQRPHPQTKPPSSIRLLVTVNSTENF